MSFSPRSVSLVEGEYRPTGEVKRFLEPSEHIPTHGKGCGPGDVNSLLEMLERTGRIRG